MVKDIRLTAYSPTLAVRPGEMMGLEELPQPTKELLCPIFLLAPWVGAHGLEKTLERIEKAFPHQAYFLDLDRYYDRSSPATDTQEDFASLFKERGYYSNWLDFVETNEKVHPCLQMPNQNADELAQQIQRIQETGRMFCVRFELPHMPENLDQVISVLNDIGTADFVIAVDAGLVTVDTNIAAFQINNFIQKKLGDIAAAVPVIVSYTTFPMEYGHIEGVQPISFDNREVVQQIGAQNNFRTIIYGDWGSTRPRMPGRIARQPLPRIDYPIRDEWIFARNKTQGWGFSEAARAIVQSSQWDENCGLNIWGERMIEETATSPAPRIKSTQKNIASRVNIHLHRQAFYERDDFRTLNLDEPWED